MAFPRILVPRKPMICVPEKIHICIYTHIYVYMFEKEEIKKFKNLYFFLEINRNLRLVDI